MAATVYMSFEEQIAPNWIKNLRYPCQIKHVGPIHIWIRESGAINIVDPDIITSKPYWASSEEVWRVGAPDSLYEPECKVSSMNTLSLMRTALQELDGSPIPSRMTDVVRGMLEKIQEWEAEIRLVHDVVERVFTRLGDKCGAQTLDVFLPTDLIRKVHTFM